MSSAILFYGRILVKVTRFFLIRASKISHSDTKRTRVACTDRRIWGREHRLSISVDLSMKLPCHSYLKRKKKCIHLCQMRCVGSAIIVQIDTPRDNQRETLRLCRIRCYVKLWLYEHLKFRTRNNAISAMME